MRISDWSSDVCSSDLFYFGRFDVRFRSVEALGRGEDFQILEVNGASAEAIHIWDPEQTVRETYRVLFEQFRLLYETGAGNRDRGHRPISLAGFLAQQWQESIGRASCRERVCQYVYIPVFA